MAPYAVRLPSRASGPAPCRPEGRPSVLRSPERSVLTPSEAGAPGVLGDEMTTKGTLMLIGGALLAASAGYAIATGGGFLLVTRHFILAGGAAAVRFASGGRGR